MIQTLTSTIEELKKENEALRARVSAPAPMPAPAPATTASAEQVEAMRAQLAANNAALAQLELEKQAAQDAKLAIEEEGLLGQRDLENADSELKRARMIGQALLIGRISEIVEDAQFGGFMTFDILMPEQVQIGTILAIRRKTGILGQLKVSDVTAEGGIANPLPGFGPVQAQIGDELILPPQY